MGAGADSPSAAGLVGLTEREVLVEVRLVVEVLVLLVVVLVLLVVVEVTLVEDEDVVEEEEGGRVEEDDEEEEEDDLVEDVDERGGFSTVLCVIAVSDLKVEVGVSGTGVVGSTPAVRSALPAPLCPSIANAMYWCVPSSNPISFQALQWLPVLIVPPQCMLVRTDQYCSKSVLSPSMLGALVRFFCQTS